MSDNTIITRRTLVRALPIVAVSAAVGGMTAGNASAASVALTGISPLIEAHRAAYAEYDAALTVFFDAEAN